MNAIIEPATIDSLKRFDTCAVANAIETFNLRLRNEGFTDSRIQCRFPQLGTFIGHAATVRIRCSAPPPDGHPYPDRTDWWIHVQSIPVPRVVVVEDLDRMPGLGAFIGEMHANILKSLGCIAAVTNGSVRDLPAVENLGFQMFSGSVSASHAYVHIVEFGHTVEVAGLRISPGDLLMGDQHGVVSIPPGIIDALPEAVVKLRQHEQEILQICNTPGLAVERLRHLVEGVL